MVFQSEASAGNRRMRVVEPSQPAASTPSTILPSREEITAFPTPGQGRVVGYVLTVHPGARVARMILGR